MEGVDLRDCTRETMALGNGFTVGWYEREGGKQMASCLHLSEPE